MFYLYSSFVSRGFKGGFSPPPKTVMMARQLGVQAGGLDVRLRILIFCALILAAVAMAAPAARAFDDGVIGTDLLAAFNQDDIYWKDVPAAASRGANDATCHEAADAAGVIDSGVQSVMSPPDASGPFGPAATASTRKVFVSVVIDDVGLDHKRSARAIDLPAGVTLAFLPYANNVAGQAALAAEKGHELMVHLPMEPSRMTANPGPDYLGVSHTAEELQSRITRNLDAFKGYKGVNNHMGSAFTKHAPGLAVLMRDLKKRGVYFLDSKTAPDSVAEDMAMAKGIPTTHRDVFLDHYETAEQVMAALAKTERIARAGGYAVAIGHPKDVTLDALQSWLPTLQAKNIELIPMSEMIKKRHAATKAYSAAATAAPASAPAVVVAPAGMNE